MKRLLIYGLLASLGALPAICSTPDATLSPEPPRPAAVLRTEIYAWDRGGVCYEAQLTAPAASFPQHEAKLADLARGGSRAPLGCRSGGATCNIDASSSPTGARLRLVLYGVGSAAECYAAGGEYRPAGR